MGIPEAGMRVSGDKGGLWDAKSTWEWQRGWWRDIGNTGTEGQDGVRDTRWNWWWQDSGDMGNDRRATERILLPRVAEGLWTVVGGGQG